MTHMLAEAYGCTRDIKDPEALLAAGKVAVEVVGARVVSEKTVCYVPHGLTVAIFLAESHVVLSTWPEHRLLLIDILLCNSEMNPDRIVDAIASRLCPSGRIVRHRVHRNIASEPA